MSTLAKLSIDSIVKTENALRQVNTESEDFLELQASVGDVGVMNPITVRTTKEEGVYELVDGRHRLTAATEAGLTEIPCHIYDNMSDHDQLQAQLVTNAIRVETKPAEYGKHIGRLLEDDPTLTKQDMANMLKKSVSWIDKVLRLQNLPDVIAEQVDEGTISLQNAVALSDLPAEEQPDWLERAMTQPAAEFVPEVAARAREIKDEKRKGKSSAPEEFAAVPKCRKGAEIIAEFNENCPTVAGLCSNKDEQAGARKAIAWVTKMDEDTVAEAKSIWEARKKDRDEAKERRTREKLESQQKKAEEKSNKLRDELSNLEE